jgi:uncharacterized protein YndB with AHSA1/START domain
MKTAIFFLVCANLAFGEVVDSASNGFTVKTTLTIAAPPADVFRKLVGNIGDWWSSEHTFSGDAHHLTMEPKAMGCFCERLTAGGAVRHMEVVFVAPGHTLVMTGALGPLQSLAANGSMTIQLEPAGEATKLSVRYAVTGYLAAGMNTWAAPVDAVLRDQFTRLKNYIEHGDAVWKAK